MTTVQFILLAALLFSFGVYGLLVRRNAVMVLLAVELMLNAVNINLIAFEATLRSALAVGQVFSRLRDHGGRGRGGHRAGHRPHDLPQPEVGQHRRTGPSQVVGPGVILATEAEHAAREVLTSGPLLEWAWLIVAVPYRRLAPHRAGRQAAPREGRRAGGRGARVRHASTGPSCSISTSPRASSSRAASPSPRWAVLRWSGDGWSTACRS